MRLFKYSLLVLITFFTYQLRGANELNIPCKDSIHKYLISVNARNRAVIYEEGKLLVVNSRPKHRFRGRLHVINDTLFYLRHDLTGKKDTFNIHSLRMVRRVSYPGDLIALGIIGASIPLYIIGIDLIYYPFFLLDPVLGIMSIAAGVTMILPAALVKMGFKYSLSYNSTYVLTTTKGFKLNSRNAKKYAFEQFPFLKTKYPEKTEKKNSSQKVR